jgi:hypothetical protein
MPFRHSFGSAGRASCRIRCVDFYELLENVARQTARRFVKRRCRKRPEKCHQDENTEHVWNMNLHKLTLPAAPLRLLDHQG